MDARQRQPARRLTVVEFEREDQAVARILRLATGVMGASEITQHPRIVGHEGCGRFQHDHRQRRLTAAPGEQAEMAKRAGWFDALNQMFVELGKDPAPGLNIRLDFRRVRQGDGCSRG